MAVIIASASAFSLISSYRTEVNSHRRILLERGQTVLDALKAGILAHGRMGRYRGERLAVIFEELAKNPGILALELRNSKGDIVVSGGNQKTIPSGFPEQPQWSHDKLVMARSVVFSNEFGPGHQARDRGGQDWSNNADWSEFGNGKYLLIAALDASEAVLAVQRHQVHLATSLCLILAAMTMGAWTVGLILKRADLAAELETERERAHRQEQVAQLGAGLAHETKNPLGIVRGLAQSIGECSHKEFPIKSRAQNIVDEVDRVIGGINSFLALARPQKAAPVSLDLDRFFEEFLPLAQMDASAARVDVSYTPLKCRVMADENLLRRAMLNLLLNALRASKAGQAVRIAGEIVNSRLSLRVTDMGCGIAQEDLPHVTEPYFTRFTGGSGLGLPIVEQIATAHGWKLKITSALDMGTQASLEGIEVLNGP